jgi:transposase, IS5 family
LCERWVENPYYQYFCGEEFFQHRLVFDRSSLTRWRNRMGEERLQALLQESLAAATKTEAIKPSELSRVIVDTTVQPKNVMFPTDAKLLNRAREKLVRLAKLRGVALRQSYAGGQVRSDPAAALCPRQAVQTRQEDVEDAADLSRPRHHPQDRGRQRARSGVRAAAIAGAARARATTGPARTKVYSLHAPEVECIGKGKAHRPYEFGVKVSVATTISHAKGGQFVTHVKALPGNPYDGHTLATVIPDIEALVGNTLERLLADKGYRGHNAPPDYKFRVFISGQKRGVTPRIKRQLHRRSAIEPVIGHLKEEHRMGRNYLWHRRGDAANAVLAAAGYNFRRLIRWLSILWRLFITALLAAIQPVPA